MQLTHPQQTMFPDMEDAEINSRLVGYCSDQVLMMIIMVMVITYDDSYSSEQATSQWWIMDNGDKYDPVKNILIENE